MTEVTLDGRVLVDRAAWTAARLEHLDAEKELTRQRDELSRRRRELPWFEITDEYAFTGLDGSTRTLAELFEGRSQLIVMHFMFGPGWPEGCPSCSFWADGYDGTLVHLQHRNTSFAVVSRAPIEELAAYRDRMGWEIPWWSSAGSSFNVDMGVSFDGDEGGRPYNFGTQDFGGDEAPGASVFVRSPDGRVFLTYLTFSRGLDMLNSTYHFLDLTPLGRDEDDLPWTMAWLHRHDAYPSS
ncbi:MAG: DUF899 family protein [Actinomycetota bacterium]